MISISPTIQYQIDDTIQLKTEIESNSSSSYKFCDLDSTISNFELNQLQGDFQEWPKFKDPLIAQMSKDLIKISQEIKQYSFSSILNQMTDAWQKILEDSRRAGRILNLNWTESILISVGMVGLSFLVREIFQPGKKKKLTNLMNEAYYFGDSYYRNGQYSQSLSFFLISSSAAENLDQELMNIRSIEKIANISNDLDQYDKAIVSYNLVFNMSQEVGESTEAGNALNKIGEIYKIQSQYQEALDSFTKAWNAVRDPNQTRISIEEDDIRNLQLNEKVVKGQILNNLGELNNELKKHSQAIEFSRQALTLGEEAFDQTIQGQALNILGIAYKSQEKITEALEAHKQALSIYQELGDPAQLAQTQTNLGSVYSSLGEYAEAAQLHQEAIATAQSLDNPEVKASILSNIGYFYHNIGQDEQALKYHQLALKIAREIQNSLLTTTLSTFN